MTEQALNIMLAYYQKQLKRIGKPHAYYKIKKRINKPRYKKALSRNFDRMQSIYWKQVEVIQELEYKYRYSLLDLMSNQSN